MSVACQALPASSCPPNKDPFPTLRMPPVVARLDLARPGEREAHDLVRHLCSGRWPLWQLFGMRRQGMLLYLAVRWTRWGKSNSYSVVTVFLDRIELRWQDVASAGAARRLLAQLGRTSPTSIS